MLNPTSQRALRRALPLFTLILVAALVVATGSPALGSEAAISSSTSNAASSTAAIAAEETRPDLTGTYDVATLTPMNRNRKYGDKLTITKKEAEEIAAYWDQNLGQDNEKSDPNREAPPEGGAEIYAPEFAGAAGGVGGYNAFYVDLGDSNFQLDGEYRTSIITSPGNGRMPPMTDAGKKRMMEQAVFYNKNTGTAWWVEKNLDVGPYDDMELRPEAERCLLGFGSTAGPPALPVMYNNLKRVVQTEDHLVILNEMNHDARIIRINSEHDPDDVRLWLGDSIGHWEGKELVVKTRHFRDEPGFTQGTRDLEVEERFSRIDKDTLRYKFTVKDPTFTEAFSGEYPWPASPERVYEYACHEGNYSLGGIMRGARLLEKEAMGEKSGATDKDD